MVVNWPHANYFQNHNKDQPDCGTVNLEGGLLMFWGWETCQGVGHVCRIDGRIDGELHTSILQDEFPATVGQAAQITQGRPQNGPNRTRSISGSVLYSHLSIPIEYLWQHPRQGFSVYEVPPAGAHELWSK